MKPKQWQNKFHVNVNANSIVQHVIQIKNETTKHVNVSAKIMISFKNIIFAILAHPPVRIASA